MLTAPLFASMSTSSASTFPAARKVTVRDLINLPPDKHSMQPASRAVHKVRFVQSVRLAPGMERLFQDLLGLACCMCRSLEGAG